MRPFFVIAILILPGLCSQWGPGLLAADPVNGRKTPLDEYVARPDPAFSWKVVKTIPGDGQTTYVVDLKSQKWRSVPEVSRDLWQHWLVVVKPDKVEHETALLFVGGGANDSPAPERAGPELVQIARATRSVVAELRMVPNQPLVIDNDGKQRKEDDLLARAWVKYMDSHDPTWLPRLPMVKSVVRAMDAVTALLASREGGKTAVKKFVVAGASKRGWTTWLTGAVDPRVVAIIPIVIDTVNVRPCSVNHFRSYGFWSPAIDDYIRHGIQERSNSPEYQDLLRIEDPYFYRNRLTMPKLILNAAGDQFFPPDSSRFYFDELPGRKYLRYVPNASHSLGGSDAVATITAFYHAILTRSALPRLRWEVLPGGSLRVRTEDRPVEVNLWQATNPKARDFRLASIGPAYKKTRLAAKSEGVYEASVPRPESGWTAFFVELVFAADGKVPLKLTTSVQIVPDTLPFKLPRGGK
jgi:PhoPQ-activated pathogenicity-related protein